jgi:thiamine biosynthesis lipoprotein
MTADSHHTNHFDAMATTFSVVIAQPDIDATYAAQVTNAIRLEVERLEEELSRFRPTSEIWRLGNLKPGQRSRITLATWDCLSLAKALHQETAGALDITIAPLMRLWRNPDGSPRTPQDSELEEIKPLIGCHLFDLHEEDLSITVHTSPLTLDLGAIGKGYALDQAVTVLNDWGIQNALLNAGDSTLLALGPPVDEPAWIVRLDAEHGHREIPLIDQALSATGQAEQGQHIMDPRTLRPVPFTTRRRYTLAPTAALADGLSTAFAVMTDPEAQSLCTRHPELTFLTPEA